MKDLGFSNAADKIQPTDAPKRKAGARYGIALLLALCGSPILLTGCDSKPQNPMLQTIPTDSEKWQDKLGDTLDQLSEEDRQLLSRYMLRMRLSEAYEKGAFDRLLTTNLVYQTEELLQKEYYVNCDMSKYIALLIDTLNHDSSISKLLNPVERINRFLAKHNANLANKK